jgi:hypothetical protein
VWQLKDLSEMHTDGAHELLDRVEYELALPNSRGLDHGDSKETVPILLHSKRRELQSVLLTELCLAGGGPIETSFGWCSAQAMEEQVDGAGMGQVALCSAADAYCWQGDYAMAAQDDEPGIAGVEVHANEQEALASHRRHVPRTLEASGTSPRMGTMV